MLFSEFLLTQGAYLKFFYGMAFFVLAGATYLQRFKREPILPWTLFAGFCLMYGSHELYELSSSIFSNLPNLESILSILENLAFLFLIDFGRQGINKMTSLKISPLAYLIIIPLGVLGYFVTPHVYFLGFLGILLTSYCLLKLAKLHQDKYLRFAAGLIFLSAIPLGLPPTGSRQLFLGSLIFVCACLFVAYSSNQIKNRRKEDILFPLKSIMAVLLIGFLTTLYVGKMVQTEETNNILNILNITAATFEMHELGALEARNINPQDSAYRDFKIMLDKLAVSTSKFDNFYIIKNQDALLYTIAKSTNNTLGEPYTENKEAVFKAFQGDTQLTEMTACSPLWSQVTNTIEGVLCGTINISSYNYNMNRIRVLNFSFIFLIEIIFILNLIARTRLKNIKSTLIESDNAYKKAGSELQKFKLAVDNVADSIIITDPEGIILYANKASVEITGFMLDDILNTKAGNLWGKLMPLETYKTFWRTIKTLKQTYKGMFINRRKTGEKYDAEIIVSPILDANAEVEFFVGIERDITKTKELDDLKDNFITLASHQMRTPLSAMKWYLEMLLNGDAGQLNAEQRNFVANVNLSNERMLHLISSLLVVAKASAGKLSVAPEITNIKTLITGILPGFELALREKSLHLETNYADTLPRINVDPKLLKLALTNCLDNAINYTPANGKLTIDVTSDNKELTINITDTGLGIPEKDLDKVFNKFFRGANVITVETEGNGLGLYLVKTIIESSKGKVWLESVLGKGTKLYITLPLV